MKQLRKYCLGMLLLTTLIFATACGNSNNANDTNNAGTNTGDTGTDTTDQGGTTAENGSGNNGVNIDDILFDTDGDGVYDHTDVDGDGLLEEIGKDSNDVVDDLVNDVTSGDGMDNGTAGDGTLENGDLDENTDTP